MTDSHTDQLVARGIRKKYGGRDALHDVDIDVTVGRITALIGPSGGGKSTLARAITLVDAPDAGSVRIVGNEYRFPAEGAMQPLPWPQTTIVFQQQFLWPHLTLRENVLMPRRVSAAAGEPLVSFEEMVELFAAAEFIDRYPNQASLGQRQRVALMRALLLGPRFLVLDEMITALDVEQASRVTALLRRLCDGNRCGILLVSHMIGVVRRISDDIVFLEAGRVAASGPRSLLANPGATRLGDFLALVDVSL